MKIRAASGRVYNWAKPNPPSAEEIDALIAFDKAQDGGGTEETRSTSSPTATASETTDETLRDTKRTIISTATESPTKGVSTTSEGTGDPKEAAKMAAGMAIRAAGPALGQTAGLLGGPFAEATVPLGGALGGAGSEFLANKLEGTPNTPGRLISAAITGAIPGASIAKAGARELTKDAVKFGAGALAGDVVESAVDKGELPDAKSALIDTATGALGAPAARLVKVRQELSQERQFQAFRDDVFRDMRKDGIKVPPHELGEGSDMLSSIGGKAALQQQAAKDNAKGFQRLVREDIGLPGTVAPIDISDLKRVRADAAEPYQKIREMSAAAKDKLDEIRSKFNSSEDRHAMEIAMNDPATKAAMDPLLIQAGADVDLLKQVRAKAQTAREAMKTNPAAYEDWQNFKAKADELENTIEQAAQTIGDDSLLKELKESRRLIAKSYDVEDSLNRGTGQVDPVVFGVKLDRGEPLDGNLLRIARFQQAFNREALDAARVAAPGVGNLGAMASASMASRGDAPGAIGAAVNATAGRPTRAFLLSKLNQEHLLRQNSRPTFAQNLMRYLAQNADEPIEQATPQ